MKSLNWPQATLYPRYRNGWKVKMLRGDLGITKEYYFLNVDNAISYFLEPDTTQAWMESTGAMPRNHYERLQQRYWEMNEEGDYTLVSPMNESEGGWMTVDLGAESGFYGDFEVLPSIYFLLRGGYLNRKTLEEMAIITEGEDIGDEDSESFERVRESIIALGVEVVWDDFLLPGLANYFRDSNTEYGIMYNFEPAAGRISGRLSPWNGPKWEDEVVE